LEGKGLLIFWRERVYLLKGKGLFVGGKGSFCCRGRVYLLEGKGLAISWRGLFGGVL